MIAQKFFSEERRKALRLINNIPLKISQEEGDIVTETLNISRSGAYCRVNRFIKPMVKLRVDFLLPLRKGGKNLSRKISCSGVVVRTEPVDNQKYFNVAIFFNDIDKKDADCITEYVSSHFGRSQ